VKDEKVEVILFDLDGTIFDITERDALARCRALNKLGHNVSLDEVRQYYRYGIGRMGIARELGVKFTEKEAKKYIESSFAHFMKREAVKLTKIHDGALDVLSSLSKRYKLVLVTSRNTLSATEEELERFDIRRFFSLVITREVAAKYHGVKDIPLLPFQEQRAKLYKCVIGLTRIDPEKMLCIGDSVGELEPAERLGIKAIGILTGFSSEKEMKDVSISTIQNLTQLSTILTSGVSR
jgi:phosphoglycolate phosphatase-like HAD superfamily hydrolase